ncbi:MAG: ABC transporter permease [Candidatus Thiodiazotropha sp. (ex Ctena orbiculata)]|nr:ABC transporter permease [Candidatus Thiodiazotropha taylori]
MKALVTTGQYLSLLLLLLLINFALPRLAPGTPLNYLLGGEDAATLSHSQRQQVLQEFGLHLPLTQQFQNYLAGMFDGDLGHSVSLGLPVSEILSDRVGWTLLLMGTAWLLSSLIGVIGGVISARHYGRATDLGILSLVLVSSAMPPFWIGMLLIILLSVTLDWLPSFGAYPLAVATGSSDYWWGVSQRLIMPALSITLVHTGSVLLTTRSAMLLALQQDYVQFARAQGASETRIFFHHALRNALLPVYTHLSVSLGAMLSGALIVETVFAWPGIGSLIVDAVHARDYPLLQGIFLITGLSIILANWLAEISYPLIDPRQGGRRR